MLTFWSMREMDCIKVFNWVSIRMKVNDGLRKLPWRKTSVAKWGHRWGWRDQNMEEEESLWDLNGRWQKRLWVWAWIRRWIRSRRVKREVSLKNLKLPFSEHFTFCLSNPLSLYTESLQVRPEIAINGSTPFLSNKWKVEKEEGHWITLDHCTHQPKEKDISPEILVCGLTQTFYFAKINPNIQR